MRYHGATCLYCHHQWTDPIILGVPLSTDCPKCGAKFLQSEKKKTPEKEVRNVISDWADEMPPDVRAKFDKDIGTELDIHTRKESPEDN